MKWPKKNAKKQTELERVEARREEVLATGRKFKYPLQWTKYRIVVDTILITLLISAVLVVGGWFLLYQMQDTGEVLYRVTKMAPVAVAEVDGAKVRFSDYLMFYRSSMTATLKQSLGLDELKEDKKSLEGQYKREALTRAEEATYAVKLAKELKVEVLDEEISKEFERHRKVGEVERSEESFLKIVKDNFGLDRNEYRRMLYLALIRAKVATAIDKKANEVVEQVEKSLTGNGGDYVATAEEMGEAISYEETGGLVSEKNIDGGRAERAMRLEAGGQSGRFVSMNGDGYYLVKLIGKTKTEVNFVSIKVAFSEFAQRFSALKDGGKIKEFISLK